MKCVWIGLNLILEKRWWPDLRTDGGMETDPSLRGESLNTERDRAAIAHMVPAPEYFETFTPPS